VSRENESLNVVALLEDLSDTDWCAARSARSLSPWRLGLRS
jgi:hypothetical protein